MSVDSRTPFLCSAPPHSTSPLTSGAGFPGSNDRKQARDQRSKWRPQLVRTRGSVVYAARLQADCGTCCLLR
ncbi:hypothetical protein NDU88_012158 [Pleurodeles waltl]|uniref:Uncharacterized protein n=1 Tax=Pleurodeles waltl TaxID=8319 RepID=A0AAV7R0V1_PLEWA|nr:hypothetical protein NDU88_012158 [Pleurodeles waltl]